MVKYKCKIKKGVYIPMKNVIDFLKDLSETKLGLSERMGAPIITTKQRSEIKQGFMKALEIDLKEACETAIDESYLDTDVIIGFTADGLVLALAHEQLAKKRLDEIPFKIEIKVANLDYDTSHEIEAFELERQEKEAEKEHKAQQKAEKIARDKEKREMQLRAKGYETE
jgi:hypothetical protein